MFKEEQNNQALNNNLLTTGTEKDYATCVAVSAVSADLVAKFSKCPTIEFCTAAPGTKNYNRSIYTRKLSANNLAVLLQAERNITFLLDVDLPSDVPVGKETKRRSNGSCIKQKHHIFFDLDFKDAFPEIMVLGNEDKRQRAIEIGESTVDRFREVGLNPWMIVFSGGGLHFHFWLETPINTEDRKRFKRLYAVVSGLIEEKVVFGKLDASCADPSHLIRLPLSRNCKNPENPIYTKVIFHDSIADSSGFFHKLASELPTEPVKQTAEKKVYGKRQEKMADAIRERITFTEILNFFPEYRSKLGSITPRDGEEFMCSSPWKTDETPSLSFNEKKKVFKDFSSENEGDIFEFLAQMMGLSIGRNAKDFPEVLEKAKEILGDDFSDFPQGDEKDKYCPADIADEYVAQYRDENTELSKLRYQGAEPIVWDESTGYYKKFDRAESENAIIRFLQQHPLARERAGARYAAEVVSNVRASTYLSPDTVKNSYLTKGSSSIAGRFLPMKNGILGLEKYLSGGDAQLFPKTPMFFSTMQFPHEFDAMAKCPRWKSILNDALPGAAEQELLQEWFGYNLIFENSFEKMLVMCGEGRNGKSVILLVLKLLLGKDNVSHVPFGNFKNGDYALFGTRGKLANISSETGEMDMELIELVKRHITGEPVVYNAKFVQPFEERPTSRLTLATNVLPRFNDKSDAIWDRILLLNFKHQISDEKRNTNYIKEEWWLESGELPGILNWALEGLRRLMQRGQFLVSGELAKERVAYRNECNPARLFLIENLEEVPAAEQSSKDIYRCYKHFCEENGYNRPLSSHQFGKEIKRVFPKATVSESALRLGHERSYVWYGIRLKNDFEPEETKESSQVLNFGL